MTQSPEELEIIRGVIDQAIEVIAPLVAVVLVSGFVFLGPVGRAIAEVIRRRLGGGAKRDLEQSLDTGEVAARLDDISHQIGEIADRQDFAERLLVRGAPGRGLPGAEGGVG